ncbi:hypothetical protein B0F90DRAFT_72744 [Multifurca ochricompacta]|uniref:DH domain-containing protein n=1 Tax=Multifurca ochricompacta TaxID=376703 RepID=A0AAD4MD46_9AGAM|nr:hypothetical protein B0F90DRAFT_72744 [Multifurca ochricompacta]
MSTSVSQSRAPIDQSRWSHSYSASIRSRSSLVRSNSSSGHENSVSGLQQRPCDLSWQPVDERDEVELISDVDTEDTDLDADDLPEGEREEERTSAIVIAEEGRGLIVRGDGVGVTDLVVHPGTTHLLIGSSSSASSLPAFLMNVLPTISTTLLALDISANFLGALPPALESCVCLEELNVSFNPLRALPLFIVHLASLRVLIADSTGITTLPAPLSVLDKLHTLSIRRNKMYSLPSWLCLLVSLQTLLVDGNPFQGPWKALMEPLLARSVSSYPPSTPIVPFHPATSHDTDSTTDTDVDDSQVHQTDGRVQEDEDTITPARALVLGRAATSPNPIGTMSTLPDHGVTRTRTTPNRAYFDKNRGNSNARPGPSRAISEHGSGNKQASNSAYVNERELRRMKSAGELHQGPLSSPSPLLSPGRLTRSQYVTSASSSNLLADTEPFSQRFATMGPQYPSLGQSSRTPLDHSLWDKRSEPVTSLPKSPNISDTSRVNPPLSHIDPLHRQATRQRSGSRKKDDKSKEQPGKWGFLKKMSMGKLRPDAPAPRPSTAYARAGVVPLANVAESTSRSTTSPMVPRPSPVSLINVRLSSTGSLGMEIPGEAEAPEISVSPSIIEPEDKDEATLNEIPPSPGPSFVASPSLLFVAPSSPNFPPSSPTTRVAKRRSFLPIGGPPPLSASLPSPGPFSSAISLSGTEDDEQRLLTPSPIPPETSEQIQRREEERAREAYTRALRSVMAYLRDMNDLSVTQLSIMSIYSPSSLDIAGSGHRYRQPATTDSARVASDGTLSSPGSVAASRSGSSDQLRSPESITHLRSLNLSQTASIATTDSGSSTNGEERKFKDDGSRRMRVVKEIVETERTYVRGLQELIDIYIKPAAAPVNLLGGVSSTKETVIPPAERRIVFSGLDSLFSFHKDIFLPALELAADAVLRPRTQQSEQEMESMLSANAARGIARTFVSHAAFMRMYSTYINNFDRSVQRIKQWVSDRPGTATVPSPHSPSLAAQATVVAGASSMAASDSSGGPQLTSSQKKRIKGYLKRCRLSPRHSQLNLEGYLLLPVQRIPRYRLLLARTTPPAEGYLDPLDQALDEISSLAMNMNEGKRESESRSKLVQWQSRIRGKFPSPLVQPHRRLIMDGPLLLTRVVRKATIAFEVIDSQGDPTTIQVECLSPEQTPRSLLGILCNDLLVLCRDPSDGKDPLSPVDLWAVLRMQTLPQPASIVHGNVLRIVDNKAILYFEASSTSVALNWFRGLFLCLLISKR